MKDRNYFKRYTVAVQATAGAEVDLYENLGRAEAISIARREAQTNEQVYISFFKADDGQRCFYNDGIGYEPIGKNWSTMEQN